MKKILFLVTTMISCSPALAADADGKSLHDTNCTKCHDSGVYTREDRFVGDRDALTAQVKRCELNLGLKWFDEDVEAVVDHLDLAASPYGGSSQTAQLHQIIFNLQESGAAPPPPIDTTLILLVGGGAVVLIAVVVIFMRRR